MQQNVWKGGGVLLLIFDSFCSPLKHRVSENKVCTVYRQHPTQHELTFLIRSFQIEKCVKNNLRTRNYFKGRTNNQAKRPTWFFFDSPLKAVGRALWTDLMKGFLFKRALDLVSSIWFYHGSIKETRMVFFFRIELFVITSDHVLPLHNGTNNCYVTLYRATFKNSIRTGETVARVSWLSFIPLIAKFEGKDSHRLRQAVWIF